MKVSEGIYTFCIIHESVLFRELQVSLILYWKKASEEKENKINHWNESECEYFDYL